MPIFSIPTSIFWISVPKLERLNPKVPPRLDFRAFWASIWDQFSMISVIILMLFVKNLLMPIFNYLSSKLQKYTYLQGFKRNTVLDAFQ